MLLQSFLVWTRRRRQIGRPGFVTSTVALPWLAFVVHNDWSALAVLVGLVVF